MRVRREMMVMGGERDGKGDGSGGKEEREMVEVRGRERWISLDSSLLTN